MTDMNTPRRPTTITEMVNRLEAGRNETSREQGLAFQPQPTDVIISPFAKSGTTWLQQMVHGLRTRGSMDFGEITEVVPWLEVAHDLGLDIHGPQVAPIRAYKSHLNWDDIPKGGRYIYSVRDPKDVLVSFYHFFEGWFFEPGSIPIEDFASEMFTKDPVNEGYWQHVASWWQQRENPAILFLSFEDMKADLPGTVQRVAEFIGVELDDELLEIVVRQSSFEFMAAHKQHFDDHLMRDGRDAARGLPPDGDSFKVRKGQVGEYQHELSDEMQAELDGIWRKTLKAQFGFTSYDDLREAVAALAE